MPRTGYPNPSSIDTLHASAARTASGTGPTVVGFGKTAWIRAQLNVTAASGTTPTLDVVLEDSLDGANWFVIGTFTQATGTGAQVLNVTAPLTDMVRARYTIGGTTPSFTFTVLVYSQ